MFDKVLVANRGEIAVRLLRTLREMNIRSVAVMSDADRDAPHVRFADEAYELGEAAPAHSYLATDKLLDVARRSGAQAILPGYGFLSENATFARKCEAQGITFVGPPAECIELMGEKESARQRMAEASVPVVPGGPAGNESEAVATASRVGYPVLVKAAFGGGGRGMRVARDEQQLRAVLGTAQSEAERAFGSGAVYVEKLLEGARHVEVQVLGDRTGRVVHLFERDCSIQRRHQKLLEETPCPALPVETLRALTDTAVSGAQAVGYHSAGTLEFLLAPDGRFYFIEMNTRLQVEHAITEMITGIDLVEQMLRVAAGQPLAFEQEQIARRGHAIECRITAEDPRRGFAPSTGTISALDEPAGPFVRIDSGVRVGQRVSTHYDSLLSKVCAWGETRERALGRMRRALSEYAVAGPTTSVEFHLALLEHPSFAAGQYDTNFVDTHPDLLANSALGPAELAALVVASHVAHPPAVPRPSAPSRWGASFRS
jgi:acetyl-CoA carboxylase biotin carboxylase subunit